MEHSGSEMNIESRSVIDRATATKMSSGPIALAPPPSRVCCGSCDAVSPKTSASRPECTASSSAIAPSPSGLPAPASAIRRLVSMSGGKTLYVGGPSRLGRSDAAWPLMLRTIGYIRAIPISARVKASFSVAGHSWQPSMKRAMRCPSSAACRSKVVASPSKKGRSTHPEAA